MTKTQNDLTTKGRIIWIDIAKALAIVGVLVDHTNRVLYTDQAIAYLSYYSVSLFIFIMGVTLYMSLQNSKEKRIIKTGKKILGIYLPYAVATVVYSCVMDKGFIWENIRNRMINYSASSPFYYVALYIQLLIIAPVLFYWVLSCKHFYMELIGIVPVIVFSAITTNHSNILNLYGGGGKLFGGTYLILLYAGMCLGKHQGGILEWLHGKKGINVLLSLILLALTCAWGFFLSRNQLAIESGLIFGAGFNPPGVSLMVYALLIAITVFSSTELLGNRSKKYLRPVGFLGKNTLYIFLFHRLVLDYIIQEYNLAGLRDCSGFPRIILYYFLMISIPLLIGFCVNMIKKCFRKAYMSSMNINQ